MCGKQWWIFLSIMGFSFHSFSATIYEVCSLTGTSILKEDGTKTEDILSAGKLVIKEDELDSERLKVKKISSDESLVVLKKDLCKATFHISTVLSSGVPIYFEPSEESKVIGYTKQNNTKVKNLESFENRGEYVLIDDQVGHVGFVKTSQLKANRPASTDVLAKKLKMRDIRDLKITKSATDFVSWEMGIRAIRYIIKGIDKIVSQNEASINQLHFIRDALYEILKQKEDLFSKNKNKFQINIIAFQRVSSEYTQLISENGKLFSLYYSVLDLSKKAGEDFIEQQNRFTYNTVHTEEMMDSKIQLNTTYVSKLLKLFSINKKYKQTIIDNLVSSPYGIDPFPLQSYPDFCYASKWVRPKEQIRRIVIHNTSYYLVGRFFRTCTDLASVHVIIDRDGTMYRHAPEDFYSFHSGSSRNTDSLSVEILYNQYTEDGMSEAQNNSLIKLVKTWLKEYDITIPYSILDNKAVGNYYDKEFAYSPLSIHRLMTPAKKGSNDEDARPLGHSCPSRVFEDTLKGDDEFFEWRRKNFSR